MKQPFTPGRSVNVTTMLLLAGMLSGQTPDAHTLAKQAAFIFEGEVTKRAGETPATFAVTPQQMSVKVLKVLYVKPEVSVRAGDLVMVQPAREASLAPRTRAIFYTNGWLYGKYLTVRELGHVVEQRSSDQVEKDIANAKAEAEDDLIRTRIDRAELVITGKVEKTSRYEQARDKTPISEHDADWWIAEVAVKDVLKGQAPQRVVLVGFPNSRDVMWAESPKFKAGDEGIFILARPRAVVRIFSAERQPVFSAINRLDFRPLTELERIKKLVKTPSPR